MSAVLIKNKEKEEAFNFYQSKPFTIDDLPRELLLKVFDNLSLPTLATCSQVCKKWRTTLGNYGDKLFLKFFKGETVKEKLQNQIESQVQVKKALTEATEKTQLLTVQNTSATRKKLILKICVVVAYVLFIAALAILCGLTWGATIGVAVYAGGLVGSFVLGYLLYKC